MNGHRDGRPNSVVDWRPPRGPRRRTRLFLLALVVAALLGGGTALSYYVEALWFESLGYGAVFWKTLNLQVAVFALFAIVTFGVLYGSFRALKPDRLGEFSGILINGQPLKLPVEPVLNLIALVLSLVIAVATAVGMTAEWPTLALYWYAPQGPTTAADPIFGRPITFYLFTLPAWQLITGWLLTLAVIACGVATFFIVITGGTQVLARRRRLDEPAALWRGLSIAFAALLLLLAARVYLGRFERLFQDDTVFAGVTYTDAHVSLTGALVVSLALTAGALAAAVNAIASPRLRWLIAAVVPAIVVYGAVGVTGWYVNSFIVKPNQLVRERPYIAHNIEMTRRAYGLDRIDQHPFPADTGIEALDAPNNQETLQNIRLWDWRALQDTLRQIQEIRTYYDFPDIDIDRYEIGGQTRQMMIAARELNIEKLPESSRNWINEKLIYTHGYGVTMNPVNGFTPEGLPQLVLSNMPIESTIPGLTVTRPEIYFGEQTNTDVYVKTRQKEFNFPQGEANSLTTYEGSGGIRLGGFFRRTLIALDRGDIAKVPFSDDITADSRLLMRRNVRDRVDALAASFLVFDPDPYVVVSDDGRLVWMIDGYTTSDTYPYARHYRLDRNPVNYMRNSVKVVIDAYDGTTTFYVFDAEDPIVAAYRAIFPTLFRDASQMPAGLRKHVRYPELLLRLQASVYGLYHMTNPEVFYNREDLWTVATEVGMGDQRQQTTQVMEPNFVLMKLPGERVTEFIEILPFTPANRNNLIGWIAGRSDGDQYGKAVVFDFPKTKLVDGPLQIEARIDQNAQLSAQLSLWNQQGSRVRRGSLIVMPVGRGLLYGEPIYLQAERSPMPELRLVVLALQDRLAYGSTFEAAMANLFGVPSTTALASGGSQAAGSQSAGAAEVGEAAADLNQLLAGAARDLSDYQRLTAEGKLAEAGRKLEDLKQKLDQLNRNRR
ncbi:MAG: membrane protein [Blastocatellia bacterium]|nr:MAG: membrane protein [Blastocatellia bacterium]